MPLNCGSREDSWESIGQQGHQPVSIKGNQLWIFLGRTDAEAETPIFWSSDVNSWLIGKIPDAGKDWGQKEKRSSEEEMAGWHHRCNGPELGQTLGDGEGQRGLVCCNPRCCRVGHDWGTEQQWQCFLRPTWLYTPGCLPLGEWPHYCGYLAH